MESETSSPWNKGRTVGKKLAFSLDQINEITKHLKVSKQWHDLCLLTLGIDTMLRGSDLLKLTVSDVMNQSGEVRGTFPLRQTKTAHGVFPVLSPTTKGACQRWIACSKKSRTDFLFTGRKTDTSSPISGCVYRCLVKRWAEAIRLDPEPYSTHSLRRTKPVYMFGQGVKIEYLTLLLGHKTPQATMEYLGITLHQAQQLALEHDVFQKSQAGGRSRKSQTAKTGIAEPFLTEARPLETQILKLQSSIENLEQKFSDLLTVNQKQSDLLHQFLTNPSKPNMTKD